MDAFAEAASAALITVRLINEASAFAFGFADVLPITANRTLKIKRDEKLVLIDSFRRNRKKFTLKNPAQPSQAKMP